MWIPTLGIPSTKEGQESQDQTSVQREQQGEQTRSKTNVVLLYVQGMTEQLQWVFRKHDIALHSKPGYTLRQALVAPKDKLSSDEKQGVIYSVRCQSCDGEYIGETERKLSTRMREHRAPVTNGNEQSALSIHNLRTGHTFDWDRIKVVDTKRRRDQRKVTGDQHKESGMQT